LRSGNVLHARNRYTPFPHKTFAQSQEMFDSTHVKNKFRQSNDFGVSANMAACR
jgi:hypothetical protein